MFHLHLPRLQTRHRWKRHLRRPMSYRTLHPFRLIHLPFPRIVRYPKAWIHSPAPAYHLYKIQRMSRKPLHQTSAKAVRHLPPILTQARAHKKSTALPRRLPSRHGTTPWANSSEVNHRNQSLGNLDNGLPEPVTRHPGYLITRTLSKPLKR